MQDKKWEPQKYLQNLYFMEIFIKEEKTRLYCLKESDVRYQWTLVIVSRIGSVFYYYGLLILLFITTITIATIPYDSDPAQWQVSSDTSDNWVMHLEPWAKTYRGMYYY